MSEGEMVDCVVSESDTKLGVCLNRVKINLLKLKVRIKKSEKNADSLDSLSEACEELYLEAAMLHESLLEKGSLFEYKHLVQSIELIYRDCLDLICVDKVVVQPELNTTNDSVDDVFNSRVKRLPPIKAGKHVGNLTTNFEFNVNANPGVVIDNVQTANTCQPPSSGIQLPSYPRQTGAGMTPPVSLNKFSGDCMEYLEFKRKFSKFVEDVYSDDDIRMTYLQSLCVGEAGRAIRGLGGYVDRTSAYQVAWRRLDQRFGNSHVLISQVREGMLSGPPIQEFDASALNSLRDKMFECEQTYLCLGRQQELNSPEVINKLFNRLPEKIKRDFIPLYRKGHGGFHELRMLVDESAADAECYLGRSMHAFQSKTSSRQKLSGACSKGCGIKKHSVVSSLVENSTPQSFTKCLFCSEGHKLWNCASFKEKSVEERYDFVKSQHLCFNCLQSNHMIKDCSFKWNCRECGKRHNTLLHFVKQTNSMSLKEESTKPSSSNEAVVSCNSCENSSKFDGVKLHKVVPVKVWKEDPNKGVYAWAYMDDGSEVSLCTTGFASRLGATLSKADVNMCTNNAVTKISWQINDIHIQGVGEDQIFRLKTALVQDSIVDVNMSIPKDEVAAMFPHLADLSFPKIESDKVEILLGQNVQNAFKITEFRYGDEDQPFGLKTGLGWAMWGANPNDHSTCCNWRVHINSVCKEEPADISCEKILEILDQDFADVNLPQDSCLSVQDKRALNFLEKSVTKVGKQYKIALPWKNDSSQLPNNKRIAEKRLQSLRRKLKSDPDLCKKYSEKMSEMLDKGYCSLVPASELNNPAGKLWYVPHHCTSVLTKFRVVFDCSAKINNVSLNDQLLQGPDLTNNLVGVLIRFRQEPVAIVGDIKSMFYQVLVDEKDHDVFRFLWFPENDLDRAPCEYRMRVHLFGATSSPCVAAFALRRTAIENLTGADFETVQAVFKNFYVDDMCVSCKTVEQAIEFVKQISTLLDSGGFKITKFLSNSKQVLDSIPEEDRSSNVDLLQLELPTQKALGVYWNAETDRFEVKVNIKNKLCTRRGLLSMISQIYDPLGLLQPFLLPARKYLQRACRMGLPWDEIIPSTGSMINFDKWLQTLPNLEAVSFDRCFKLHDRTVRSVELHVFTDASTEGYGACAYLRVLYNDGFMKCSLIMGKSRVAPLNVISVPRLELTAAVLAAKIGVFVQRELEYKLNKVLYWTDATVVLRYLCNETTRFKTFVANRLEILHTLTSLAQWRYVPTKLNPADIASRGLWPEKVTTADLWFNGPQFLCYEESEWPNQPEFLNDIEDNDPEVKKVNVCSTHIATTNDIISRLLRRYSSFRSLQCTVAWLLRYKQYLRSKAQPSCESPKNGFLTINEMDCATLAIVAVAQRETFAEVFQILHNHSSFEEAVQMITEKQLKRFPCLRPLQKLNPYLVDGVLRVGGRLHNAPLTDEMKYPILLPNNHFVTELLIMCYHVNEGHMGTSHVLSVINQKYWIMKGRATVKKVLRTCFNCRFWKAKVGEQQMGNLPASRVTPSPPFQNCGTDLMGPLSIRNGRSNVKRYVCCFNCLASRAVHFEIVQSLEASAFIQAFRRFCNRRITTVRHVYSDNGSNFTSANRELNEAIEAWKSKHFQDAMLQEKIIWHFGPPLASHQNGFTEAFFRIVRKLIRSLVNEATLDEFDLLTLMTEIERIINDRPVTSLPSGPDELSALTPSMVLTGALARGVAPGVFMKPDEFRRSWRKTQYLADVFWQRWLKEYLPLLQPRRKWFALSRNLKPGDLVLLKDESAKRGCWPKGIVDAVMPDSSDLVRRVKVRTANSTFVRDVRKLCLLETFSDEHEDA